MVVSNFCLRRVLQDFLSIRITPYNTPQIHEESQKSSNLSLYCNNKDELGKLFFYVLTSLRFPAGVELRGKAIDHFKP